VELTNKRPEGVRNAVQEMIRQKRLRKWGYTPELCCLSQKDLKEPEDESSGTSEKSASSSSKSGQSKKSFPNLPKKGKK